MSCEIRLANLLVRRDTFLLGLVSPLLGCVGAAAFWCWWTAQEKPCPALRTGDKGDMFDFLGGGSRLEKLQDEEADKTEQQLEEAPAAEPQKPPAAPNWLAELARKNAKAAPPAAAPQPPPAPAPTAVIDVDMEGGTTEAAEEDAASALALPLAAAAPAAAPAETKGSMAKKSARRSSSGSQSARNGSPRRALPMPKTEIVDADGIVIDDYMRRADYGRLIRMDANVQSANQVRWERMQIKRQQQEQREAFRQRGVRLRGERLQTEANIAHSVDTIRQNATALGDNLRLSNQALREKRAILESEWKRHGRDLTEKYSTRGNQELVRHLKKEVADRRMSEATVMRNFLKKAKQETDDTIRQVNRDRVERVYAETAHDVIRVSKQTTVASRWDRADAVRRHKNRLKEELRQKEHAYLQRAMAIQETTQKPVEAAILAQRRQEERTQYAREMTQWRKDIKAQREVVAADVRASKRSVRDSIEYGQLIRRQNVEREVATGILAISPRGTTPRQESDDPLGRFVRFFGFKSSWKPVPSDNLIAYV